MVFSDDFLQLSKDQEKFCRIHQNYLVALKRRRFANFKSYYYDHTISCEHSFSSSVKEWHGFLRDRCIQGVLGVNKGVQASATVPL